MFELVEQHKDGILGVHKYSIDDKNRVVLPKEWRDIIGTPFILMRATDHLVLLPNSYVNSKWDGAIIYTEKTLDNTGKFHLEKELYGTKMPPKTAWMIGKGGYVEIYLDEESYNQALKNSDTAIKKFKQRITNTLQNP